MFFDNYLAREMLEHFKRSLILKKKSLISKNKFVTIQMKRAVYYDLRN